MIKVGIIGGAGYTAGELIRILINHPQAEISYVHSNSHAGQPVWAVHSDLAGDTDIHFADTASEADVVFLCLGHNKSIDFLNKDLLPGDPRIIDMSQDFRNNPVYRDTRNRELEFVYGLPECNREKIREARYIANPGCFATAFELALLPLAKAGLLTDPVQINGITGSTGAGQAPTATTHFSWRNDNISIYKPFNHQHLKEVRRTLESVAGNPVPELNFLPLRGDFARGIFLSAYTSSSLDQDELARLFGAYYKDAAFTFVCDHDISMKEIVNTNKCFLRVEKYDHRVLVTSVIDNLLKGASGQAVQNMNLMFGLNEKTGLSLKSIVF